MKPRVLDDVVYFDDTCFIIKSCGRDEKERNSSGSGKSITLKHKKRRFILANSANQVSSTLFLVRLHII